MSAVIFWTVVVIVAMCLHVNFKNKNKQIEQMFPALPRLPFLGNLLSLIRSREGLHQFRFKLCNYFKHKPFAFWLLYKPYVVISDFQTAKIILSDNELIDKSEEYDIFVPWLGRQLFCGNGSTWRRFRKFVAPAFHFKTIVIFLKTFYKNADVLCKQLEIHDGKEAFDIYEYLTRHTLDNICETAMGVDMKAQADCNSNISQAIRDITTVILLRNLIPFFKIDWVFRISPLYSAQDESLKVLRDLSSEVIQRRKALETNTCDENGNSYSDDTKCQKSFLELLLQGPQENFTDEEIQREVDLLLFAGQDTTATALGFTFYELAQHQDVQDKLYEELNYIFQDSNRCPNFEDLQNMKYTEQAIKESLRLYPPIPLILRKPRKDVHLSKERYIPKGTNTVIAIAAIHRDPDFWENPNLFNPDRFLEETDQKADLYSHLAFSGGPRNCLGQKYAMFQMKITISKIIRNYKLYPSENSSDNIRPKSGIVLTSTNGMRIKLKARKNVENNFT